MVLGNDFEVFANVKNNYMDESKVVQCKVVFMAAAVGYNGKIGSYCAVSTEEMEVAPSEGTGPHAHCQDQVSSPLCA